MVIVDTDVVSELMRPRPNPDVVCWVGDQPASALFTTAITQAEILYGIVLLPEGRRRTALELAVEDMFTEDFAGRVLPFDGRAAPAFARIVASRRLAGCAISHADGQIAAIAARHGAVVATRNVRGFEDCGLELLNPWEP